jgi:phosphatidylserine/phosphatidylglycerophosphate/cardiolipin synthase-like enzyme
MRVYGRSLGVGLLLIVSAAVPISVQARGHSKHYDLSDTCSLPHPATATMSLNGALATVDFSPNGNGEALILRAIGAARQSILIQAYSFTDRRIVAALGKAKARGVDVRVILDKSDSQSYEGHEPVASVIRAEQIPVWIDTSVNIAHNKVMIIDELDLITGSYNFTYSAAHRNAENLLYIRKATTLAAAYVSNWYWRKSCAKPYTGHPLT